MPLPKRPKTTPPDGEVPGIDPVTNRFIDDPFGNDLWPLQLDAASEYYYGPDFALTPTGQKLMIEFNRKWRVKKPAAKVVDEFRDELARYKSKKQP